MKSIIYDDNLNVLKGLEASSIDLIYIDPPFNTGKRQERSRLKTVQDEEEGYRTGYKGKRYRTVCLGTTGYNDRFYDFLAFLKPRMIEAYRVLKDNGSLFFHIDYREVHYCKVMLDGIFGRNSFMNEIIWAYDYGARTKKRWSAKHDNILWYAKNPINYIFNYEEMDRVPYMAPGLVGEEKAARERLLPMFGGIQLLAPTAKRRRDMRLKSLWGY
jgi:site-specific DNA-methyltransferase (adenine-specific)